MNAGGKFTILVPNIPEVEEKLSECRLFLDEWFMKKFAGKLSIILNWDTIFSGKEFRADGDGSFKEVVERAQQSINQEKKRKFASLLYGGKIDLFRFDSLYDEIKEDGVCSVCGVYPGIDDGVCENCREMQELGELIVKNRNILTIWTADEIGISIPGGRIIVCGDKKAEEAAKEGIPYLHSRL